MTNFNDFNFEVFDDVKIDNLSNTPIVKPKKQKTLVVNKNNSPTERVAYDNLSYYIFEKGLSSDNIMFPDMKDIVGNNKYIVISIPTIFKPSILWEEVINDEVVKKYFDYENGIINKSPSYYNTEFVYTWSDQNFANTLCTKYISHCRFCEIYPTKVESLIDPNKPSINIISTLLSKNKDESDGYGILIDNSYYGIEPLDFLWIKPEHRIKVLSEYPDNFYTRVFYSLKNNYALSDKDMLTFSTIAKLDVSSKYKKNTAILQNINISLDDVIEDLTVYETEISLVKALNKIFHVC